MKRKIWSILIMIVIMCGCACALVACKDPRKDLSLSSETQSIELILGDADQETKSFDVHIENYSEAVSGIIGFDVIGDSVVISNVNTNEKSSTATCEIKAIRSGSAQIKATLYDGGEYLLIPVNVIQPVNSIRARSDIRPYIIKGAGEQVLDKEKLIEFSPVSTTQRDVYFMIDNNTATSISIDEDDTRESVVVTAISENNENIRTNLNIRLISPISELNYEIEDSESEEVLLAVNHADKNIAVVEFTLTSLEQRLTSFNKFYKDDEIIVRLIEQTDVEDLHKFKFEISALKGEISRDFSFKFGISEDYDYMVEKTIHISSITLAKNIAINLQTENYETIRVFNYNSAQSKGSSINFAILPQNSANIIRYATVEYDDNLITLYNSKKEKINSGTEITSGTTLWVKGNANTVDSTSILFTVEGIDGFSEDLTAQVDVEIYEGVRGISGDDNVVLTLSADGSKMEGFYTYNFDVIPSGAYTGQVWLESKSSNIAVELGEGNSVKVKALSVGQAKFNITLANGITKTVNVDVISQLNEDSLVLDVPNSNQNEFVGSKTPVVVGRSQPLQKVVIQKSLAYEKAVPISYSYYPLNASIINYNYTITKIDGQKDNILEIVNNSLVGRNEGEVKVDVEISYYVLEDGQKVVKTQTFSFIVEVYVAVSQFYFSQTTINVADLNSVGFYKLNEATTKLSPHIYPVNATNGGSQNIIYTMTQGIREGDEGEILKNDYISFNTKTGEITGRLEKGTTPLPTTITATLIDESKIYTIPIIVNVQTYEQVKAIVVDNVTVPGGKITLSAGKPNFQIIAHAVDLTAYNATLIYTFIPKNENSKNVVNVSDNGLIKLDVERANSDNLGGFIRISAQDSYKNDNINPELYIDIEIDIAIGTKDSPYVISSKQELLAINNDDALSKFYRIEGVIDLGGEEISPLGKLTGGITGIKNSKIIGINVKNAKEASVGLFTEIAAGAFIENLGFEGVLNYNGEASYVGLVAGINNGTIKNCSIVINSSNLILSSSCFVGGVVGINNKKIITEIYQGKYNFNLVKMNSSSLLKVVASNDTQVYVGGVVGCNNQEGVISRIIGNVSLYNNDGYSSIVNITTENCYSVGGVVGINNGTCVGLCTDGTIKGQDNVGGFVGYMNMGTITSSENASCFSNTFVKGGEAVGGFVGYMAGGIISQCGVQIYEQLSYQEENRLLVQATGNCGGFVGVAYAGTLSDDYVASFRSSSSTLISMNSTKSTSTVGGFVGLFSGANINNCDTNITCQKENQGIINEEIYSGTYKPEVPESVKLKILQNEMITSEDVNYKVLYLTYKQSIIVSEQSNLSNFVNLGEYISHNLSDAGVQVTSKNNSIIKITSDGVQLVNSGICELIISSRYNPTLKKSVFVNVVNYCNEISLSSNVDGISYMLDEFTTIATREGDLLVISKEFINNKFEQINLVQPSPYHIVLLEEDADNFEIVNFEKTFTISTKTNGNYEKNQKNELDFQSVYVTNIDGREFVSEPFNHVLTNLKIYVGTTDIKTLASEYELMASDELRIDFTFTSALGDEEKLYVVPNRPIYINGNLTLANQKGLIWDKNNSNNSFIVKTYNSDFIGNVYLTIVDENSTYNKDIVLKIKPQNVNIVSTRYIDNFDYISKSQNPELMMTSNIITPGKFGLLVVDILPKLADIDYICIENVSTNPVNIQFELLDDNFARLPGAILTQNEEDKKVKGIKIPATCFKRDGLIEQIYLKTMIVTEVQDNQLLTLRISTSDGYTKDVQFVTKLSEMVKGTIVNKEINGNQPVYLAKGLNYTLNINAVGYTPDQVIVENEDSELQIIKISDLSYNLFIENKLMINRVLTLKVYGQKEVDGMIVKTAVQQISILPVEFVVNSVSFVGAVDDEMDLYLDVSKSLQINLQNGISAEYDINSPSTISELNSFISELNKNGKFELINANEGLSLSGNTVKATQLNAQGTVKFSAYITYDTDSGRPKIESSDNANVFGEVGFNIRQLSSASSMIPIYNSEEFMNMQNDSYYILMEDITLNNFTPITANIAGFDGNNKKITIKGYENNEETNVNFGLFEEIDKDVIVQNVYISIDNFVSSITASNVNFGFITAKNNGIITNCYVLGTENSSAKISLAESATFTGGKNIGGIAAENNGYITNCRIEIPIFSTSGNVAGICAINNGSISSCYVKNTTIINNSIYVDAKTAGIVCENKKSGIISGCYIEGNKTQGKVYCDTDISIRSNNIVGAFVYTNAGEISNCYTNIYLMSGATAAGFVYENQPSGIISNCFSLCLLRTNMSNNYPFVAQDATGLVDTTAGKFNNCYFVKDINSWTSSNQNISGISILENSELLKDATNFNTYGLSSISASQKGIWTLYNGNGDKYDYPRLISANNIIKVSKNLDKTEKDPIDDYVIYFYTNMPNGEPNNPYLISNAKQFEQDVLSSSKNGVNSSYFRLISDVDYLDTVNGVSTSNLYKINFCGELDGNQLSIINYSNNSQDKLENAGLFATIGKQNSVGIVKNITLKPKQINFPNASKVGALAGSIIGSGVYNVTCKSDVDMIVKGLYKVGGIAGYMTNSSLFTSQLISCNSSINTNATSLSQTNNDIYKDTIGIFLPNYRIANVNICGIAGGLVGYVDSGDVLYGKVSGNIGISGQIVGGIVGYLGAGANMSNCQVDIWENQYIQSSFTAGGLVGCNYGKIKDSYLNGNKDEYFKNLTVAPCILGGLVGINYGSLINNNNETKIIVNINIENMDCNFVGGIVGYMYNGTVSGFQYIGKLLGKINVAGIVGVVDVGYSSVKISNCKVGDKNVATSITAFATSKNWAGAIIGNESDNRSIYAENNICANNVLFTRTCIKDDAIDDNFTEKKYNDIIECDYFINGYEEVEETI